MESLEIDRGALYSGQRATAEETRAPGVIIASEYEYHRVSATLLWTIHFWRSQLRVETVLCDVVSYLQVRSIQISSELHPHTWWMECQAVNFTFRLLHLTVSGESRPTVKETLLSKSNVTFRFLDCTPVAVFTNVQCELCEYITTWWSSSLPAEEKQLCMEGEICLSAASQSRQRSSSVTRLQRRTPDVKYTKWLCF